MQYPNQHPSHVGGAPSFPPPPPPPQTQLPPGWVQTTDPNSGRPYYANPITGQTSWEPPQYFPPPPPPPTPMRPALQPQSVQQTPQQHQVYSHLQHAPPQLHLTSQPIIPPAIAQPLAHPNPAVVYPPLFAVPTHLTATHTQSQQYPLIQPQYAHAQQGIDPNSMFPVQHQPPSSIQQQPATQTNIPTPSITNAMSHLGPSTAITPGLLVPSVRAMIDAEYTQKMNSGESATVPKLELDGLTAGAIADLCNVSSDWRSRNVCIDKGDFADDVNGETKVTGDFSTINGNNFHGKSTSQGEGNQNDGSNQYYFPLQPFQLPVSSRPPHIEPGRVDIRLHALYNKLGKMM